MSAQGELDAAGIRDHASARLPLGSLLIRDGLLTLEQLEVALAEKETSGDRLGEILVARKWVSAQAVASAIAEQHGLEAIDLARTEIDPAIAGLLPEHLARRYDALPVRFEAGETLLLALADPTDVFAIDEVRLALGTALRIAVAPTVDLRAAFDRVYRTPIEVDEVHEELPPDLLDEIRDVALEDNAPVVRLVYSLISRAIDERASDIHLSPQAAQLLVRVRVDGVMRLMRTLPRRLQPMILSRLKIMANLDIAERRAPQDGRISIRFGGEPMDLRLAVIPTTHGEQAVLRIMNRSGKQLRLDELGMSADVEQIFTRAIRRPFGGVLAVGPTGSGKTTTLYAALDLLNGTDRVLTTIEDPVEYQTEGLNQVEVNVRTGLTFARGLRTILRSDPDVLLVGEIRDEETAKIAIQAALTGHLVLSTLHTHNAVGAIARLADMGVEATLLATAIDCIVAQRLARRLCVHCREPFWPERDELAELGLDAPREDTWLYRPVGCVHCAGSGYNGRIAFYEALELTEPLRRLIRSGAPEELLATAAQSGMRTLREDGNRLCLSGVTTLDEIRRVTGDRLL